MRPIEHLQVKTLRELSYDSDNSRYLVRCVQQGYDLDGFVKDNIKPNGYDYQEDTKASADAIVDNTLLTSCNYVNFIEFKSGSLELNSIRKKAIDSISLYGLYLDTSDLKTLPKNRRFLLIYRSKGSRDFRKRARNIIRNLEKDIVVRGCYDAGLKYHSEVDFDQNHLGYLD